MGERWCRGGSAAARRRSELSGLAESGGWPCSASLVVRPSVNDTRLLCKVRGQVRGVRIVPASWDFDERLTVAEIQRRGGARLGFVGNGSCGTERCREGTGWFLFIGRRTNLGVHARAKNHGEIPSRRLRFVGETELTSGPAWSVRGGATRSTAERRAGERLAGPGGSGR